MNPDIKDIPITPAPRWLKTAIGIVILGYFALLLAAGFCALLFAVGFRMLMEALLILAVIVLLILAMLTAWGTWYINAKMHSSHPVPTPSRYASIPPGQPVTLADKYHGLSQETYDRRTGRRNFH
jgi:hypothetical protein